MDVLYFSFVAWTGYLLGSIPTGYLAGRARGVDIRTLGSGNIGATNVFRILGKPAGVLVLLCDALKGFVACAWLPVLVWGMFSAKPQGLAAAEYSRILGGFAAILGHNYTCWLRFRGGKGVATSAGVVAALMPYPFLAVLGIWIILAAATRYVSVASITAAAALPVAAWQFGHGPRIITLALLIGGLAIYKHRPNIRRLLDGTEHRIGSKKTEREIPS